MTFINKLKNMNRKLIIIISALILCLILGGVGISKYANAAQVKEGITLGNKYLEEGKYEEAILAFQKVIEVEPKNVDARVGVAKVYIKTSKLDEAEKMLKEAIGINPKKVESYLELSKLYISENNLISAINILTEGVQATNDENIKTMLEDLKSKITVTDISKIIILGESYSLPNEVEVMINNISVKYPVKWETTVVDADKLGISTFNGTLEDTEKSVTLTLEVVSILSIRDINNSIKQNDQYSLPSKVTAMLSNNSTQEVAATWNPASVDTSKVGSYSFEGTVIGYNNKVKLNLNIKKPYASGEEIQVFNNLLNDTIWKQNNGIRLTRSINEHHFVDLDQDGVYEMLIEHGTCEADRTVSVVIYNSGNVSVQHLPSGIGYYGYSESTKVFFLRYMHMGYYTLWGYKLENGNCKKVFTAYNDEDAYADSSKETYKVNEKEVSKAEYQRAVAAFGKIE